MLECLQAEEIFKFHNLSLEFILVRDSEMCTYNKEYMDCKGPTNILSFPQEDDENLEEDIKANHNISKKEEDISSTFNTSTNPFFNKKKHSSKSKTILRSNLGTLVLSVDTLERECILYGQNPHKHAIHLLAHGLAHLLGYDHGEEMQQLTELLERNISYKNDLYTFTPLWSYYHG